MTSFTKPTDQASARDERDWRWRAKRLAHEVERAADIKRARGIELDPLDARLVELTREILGPLR